MDPRVSATPLRGCSARGWRSSVGRRATL